MTAHFNVHRDLMLSIGTFPNNSHILFADNSKALAKNFLLEESVNIGLRGLFCILQVCHPNLATVTAGMEFVVMEEMWDGKMCS